MVLNPFEDIKNEYELKDILEKKDVYWSYRPKEEYKSLFGEWLDYDVLVKSINTKIDWHILETGCYQGDYWYFGLYNDKVYFIDIGYGSCSGCDSLMACQDYIDDLIELQDEIKRDIREFDNLEELINWIINSNEWWLYEQDRLLDYIKKEFDIDFEMINTCKLKE